MYNYYDAMKDDVLQAIQDNYTISDFEDRSEFEEFLNDELWIDDSVTGNASGSYTFSRSVARDYVMDNLDLLRDACNEFGCIDDLGDHFINEDFEWMDVTIRCYLLGQAIAAALDEFDDDEYAQDEEETEEGTEPETGVA